MKFSLPFLKLKKPVECGSHDDIRNFNHHPTGFQQHKRCATNESTVTPSTMFEVIRTKPTRFCFANSFSKGVGVSFVPSPSRNPIPPKT
eukprot:542504-Amphidinium_carterae.1